MDTGYYTFETACGEQISIDIKAVYGAGALILGYEIEVLRDGDMFLFRQCSTPEQVRAVIEDLPFEGI